MSDDEGYGIKSAIKPTRVGKLDTIDGVNIERARVYRAIRHGKLASLEGFRLSAVLTQQQAGLEASSFGRRLELLEQQVDARGLAPLLEAKRVD